MQEPRLENGNLVVDFRSINVRIQPPPEDCDGNQGAFEHLADLISELSYEGYIASAENNYQLNLNFDEKLLHQITLQGTACEGEPELDVPKDVAHAIGRKADMVLRLPHAGKIVVEIEKANREKIIRDIVKMLVFLDKGQADFAALVCPCNYVHSGGLWNLFDVACQIFPTFVQVTQLPKPKAAKLAIIGFTQEVFLDGRWVTWGKPERRVLKDQAHRHF